MREVKLKKISSSIQREISDILANEATDELLKTITITGCEANSDMSIAKVYFTSLISNSKEDLERELNEAAPYVRKELASRIEIRHTPELIFTYDESIAYGEKIEKIIEEIHKED